MNKFISLEKFEKAVTPGQLRLMRIIQIMQILTPLGFLGVIFLEFTARGKSTVSFEMIETLSFFHVLATAIAVLVSNSLYRSYLKRDIHQFIKNNAIMQRDNSTDLADGYLYLIRSAMIFRFTILEGAAFFGLVILYFASKEGILQSHPQYWVNLLSTGVVIIAVIMNFVTTKRMVKIYLQDVCDGARIG